MQACTCLIAEQMTVVLISVKSATRNHYGTDFGEFLMWFRSDSIHRADKMEKHAVEACGNAPKVDEISDVAGGNKAKKLFVRGQF